MATDPPRDLTAERAAKIADYANECCHRSDGYREDVEAKVLEALKQTRQDALREAARVADQCALERKRQLFSAFDQQCRDFISCKQSEAERIAEKLDRLASEGG